MRHALAFALCAAVCATRARRAGAEPEPEPERPAPYVLSSFDGDPDGTVSRADLEAQRLLEGGDDPALGARHAPDPVAAARAWMAIAERDPDVAIDVPASLWPAVGTGLPESPRWRAREVALLRLAHLPPPGLAEVEARAGPAARHLVGRATEEHDVDLLRRAADAYPTTEAGRRALLACADLDLETGGRERAALALARWLRLSPREPARTRAEVLARLVDALAHGDPRARADALRRAPDAAGVAVRAGPGPLVSPRNVAARRTRDGRRRALATPAGAVVALPPTLVRVWSRGAVDPGLLRPSYSPEPRFPLAAAAVVRDALFVAEERVVRRLDVATGLVRWTWPRRLPSREIEARPRYRAWEEPVRAVVPAGDAVLCVLGDPPMPESTSFRFRGSDVAPGVHGRECRARLLCLDAGTGDLRWATGAPSETDPVVGSPDVACASPPLVVRDEAWAVFGARRGAVRLWLCRFALADGRVLSTTFLGTGESGIAHATSSEPRLFSPTVQSVPVAQRPVPGNGEVCVATQAGFAAGVDGETGRLRWAQALPRYDETGDRALPRPTSRFSPRNAPLAAFGRWFVAPADGPALCALEPGSGRLLWVDAAQPAPPADRVHLLAARVDAEGRAWVDLAGRDARAFSAADGRRRTGRTSADDREEEEAAAEIPFAGRPWTDGRSTVVAEARGLRVLSDDAEGPTDAGRVEGGTVPGDLLRADAFWIVVGTDRIEVLAAAPDAERVVAAQGADPADAAARACLRARGSPSVEAFRAAATAVTAAKGSRTTPVESSRALDEALEGAGGALVEGVRGADATLGALAEVDRSGVLGPDARSAMHDRVAVRLIAQRRAPEVVDLAYRWMEWGHGSHVRSADGGERVRGDLRAAARAAEAVRRGGPEARRRFLAHAVIALRDLEAAGSDETRLREVSRRWRGTEAAWAAHVRLASLALDGGRPADAAARLSDARVDPPIGARLPDALTASLRAAEGGALAEAGETEAARAALHDADRLAPAAARTAGGGLASALDDALAAGHSIAPTAGEEALLPLWDELPPPVRIRGTVVLDPSGPGAHAALDSLLVASGVDVFAWSPRAGGRTPVAPEDVGWLGANLREREPALPGPGVLVGEVLAGQPADRAGLLAGDWILSWGGQPVDGVSALNRAVSQSRPGEPVELVTRRGGVAGPGSVVPARRPADEPTPLDLRFGPVGADGRAVVASRFGLRSVDPRSGDARRLWRWDGEGAVVSARGFGPRVLVSVRSRSNDDVLVCVDAVLARERWRARIDGTLAGDPRVEGSSVVVDAVDPDRTWLVDLETGSVRAVLGLDARYPFALSARATPPPARSTSAAGFLYRHEGGTLSSFSTATGARTASAHAGMGGYDTQVTAGGLVVLVGDELRFHVPDLRGALAPGVRVVPPSGTEWGYVAAERRVLTSGDAIYASVASERGPPRLVAIAVDRSEAARRSERASRIRGEQAFPKAGEEPAWVRYGEVVVASRASPEGAWILALRYGSSGEPDSSFAAWVSAEVAAPAGESPAAGAEAPPGSRLVPVPLTVSPTQGFVAAGRRLLVPADAGVVAIPLR